MCGNDSVNCGGVGAGGRGVGWGGGEEEGSPSMDLEWGGGGLSLHVLTQNLSLAKTGCLRSGVNPLKRFLH